LAFEWIPFDKKLPEKPEIGQIARALGISRADAILGCLQVWAWVDSNSEDGHVHAAIMADVDYAARRDGFGQAMKDAGWILPDPDGLLFPNTDRWITRSAKRRLRDADRKRRTRAEGE